MKKQGELKGSVKNELLRGAGIDSGEYRVRSTTPRGSGAGMRWLLRRSCSSHFSLVKVSHLTDLFLRSWTR